MIMLVYQIEQLELESVAAARFEYAWNGDDLEFVSRANTCCFHLCCDCLSSLK